MAAVRRASRGVLRLRSIAPGLLLSMLVACSPGAPDLEPRRDLHSVSLKDSLTRDFEHSPEGAPDPLELLRASDDAMRDVERFAVLRRELTVGLHIVDLETRIEVEQGAATVVGFSDHSNLPEGATPEPLAHADRYLDRLNTVRGDIEVAYVLREEDVAGEAAWVVWYEIPIVTLDTTPPRAWRTEWISKGTLRLLHQYEIPSADFRNGGVYSGLFYAE